MMEDHIFGASGGRIVIEECMVGEEASLLAFVDGKTIVPMISAQDHKRIFDNDEGPNTGGMGAYAPAPVFTPAIQKVVEDTILRPVVDGLKAEGITYQAASTPAHDYGRRSESCRIQLPFRRSGNAGCPAASRRRSGADHVCLHEGNLVARYGSLERCFGLLRHHGLCRLSCLVS